MDSPMQLSSSYGGNTQLTLTVNASANTTNNGNAYVKDTDGDVGGQPTLLLGASTVGSGTPGSIASNSGVFNISIPS